MSVVIVAIPEDNDPVWKVSSEKKPHMTLLFLGDSVPDEMDAVLFLEHAVKMSMRRFGLSVDKRGKLGDEDADVLFFDKSSWMIDNLKEFRSHLLTHAGINLAYQRADQFPSWTPHLTLGYPDAPAKNDAVDYPINYVSFDRIAIWTEEDDGPEFYIPRGDDLFDTYHDDLEHAFGDFVKKFKESDVVRDARGQFAKAKGGLTDWLDEMADKMFGDDDDRTVEEKRKEIENILKDLDKAFNNRRDPNTNKDVFNPDAKLDTSQIGEERKHVDLFDYWKKRWKGRNDGDLDNELTKSVEEYRKRQQAQGNSISRNLTHDLLVFDQLMDDYLEHYGVKGMQWGVRKDRVSAAGYRGTGVVRVGGKMSDKESSALAHLVGNSGSYSKKISAKVDADLRNIQSRYNEAELVKDSVYSAYRKEANSVYEKYLNESLPDGLQGKVLLPTNLDYPSYVVVGNKSGLAYEVKKLKSEGFQHSLEELSGGSVVYELDGSASDRKFISELRLGDRIEHSIDDDLEESVLFHYGVLGMRWGVRRAENKYGVSVPSPKDNKWSKSRGIDTATLGFLDRLGVRMVDRDVVKSDNTMLKNDLKIMNKRPAIEKKDPDGMPRDGTLFRSEKRLNEYLSRFPKANRIVSHDKETTYLLNRHEIKILRDKKKKKRGEDPYVTEYRHIYSIRDDRLKHGDISDQELKHLETLSEEELFHYGVKGMRWGYRRPVGPDGYVRGAVKKVRGAVKARKDEKAKAKEKAEKTTEDGKPKSIDQIRMEKTLAKSLDQMSTREIKELNARVEQAAKLQKHRDAMSEAEKGKIRKLASFVIDNAKKGAVDAAGKQIENLAGDIVNDAVGNVLGKGKKDDKDDKGKKDKKDDKPKQNPVTDPPAAPKKTKKTKSSPPASKNERDMIISDLTKNVYNVTTLKRR